MTPRLDIAATAAFGAWLAVSQSPVTARMQIPAAPQQVTPQRDTAPRQQRGTAVIRGRVVGADTGRPLRRARITIRAPELGSDNPKVTSTNLEGRYEFKDLPAARYRVSVTRAGYLALDYGQRRPGEQGRPAQLSEGQTLESIDFRLPRMGIITGRVYDEAGEPIEGVRVYAMRVLFFEGRRRFVPVSSDAATDDAGEYRILKLAPGTYVVMASTRETWAATEDGKETVFGYMPTYFPGVANPAEARRVTLGVGQQAVATDFLLIPGRAAKVSGMAVDSMGRPFSRVHLSEDIRGLDFASFRGGPSGPVAADGSFTIVNVPPGEYTATASRMARDPQGDPEVALTTISVDGTDIENLSLVGSSGGTVSGRVVAEGGAAPKMSAIRVSVSEPLKAQPSPALLGAFRSSGGFGSAPVREDGSFSVEHVFGRTRFQVAVPDGWMLRTVQHDGRDITDALIELKSGEEMTSVEVVITNQVTHVGGQLTDEKGAPLRDATVLVFPTDADRWFESSRSVRATRPDQYGQWQIKGLPAGEYLAIALDYVEDGAWNDPEYLESLRRYAQKLNVTPDVAQTVTLKIVAPKE